MFEPKVTLEARSGFIFHYRVGIVEAGIIPLVVRVLTGNHAVLVQITKGSIVDASVRTARKGYFMVVYQRMVVQQLILPIGFSWWDRWKGC